MNFFRKSNIMKIKQKTEQIFRRVMLKIIVYHIKSEGKYLICAKSIKFFS